MKLVSASGIAVPWHPEQATSMAHGEAEQPDDRYIAPANPGTSRLQGTCMRPSGRAPDQMRAIVMEPGFTRHAEGSCLVSFGDTRVLCTASVETSLPALAARQGPGLGDRRIWHAAARHPHPRAPRGGGRQAIGPDPGDPAADRPLAARRGRPRGARRAPDHARLRRHPGRRRHPHRRHLRRLGGAAARGRRAARAEADRGRPDPPEGRGGELRHPWRQPPCSTSIMSRTAPPAATAISC